jgi:hypothetical protein
MKRVLLVLTLLFVFGVATAFHAAEQATPPPSPAAAPTPPAAASPAQPDPLDEFVPRQKLGAESVVSLPVDI